MIKKLLTAVVAVFMLITNISSTEARVFYLRPAHLYEFVEKNGYEFVELGYEDRHADYGPKGYVIEGKKIKTTGADGELRALAHAYNNITKASSTAEFKAAVKKDIYAFEHLDGEFVDYTTNKDVFIESFFIYCSYQESLRKECKNLYNYIKNNVIEFKFTDVSDNSWYRDYVEKAYCLGLMTGASDSLFKPNSNMNRGMVAVVLYRMSGSPKITYKKYFKDVDKNQYYSSAVTWAKKNGVINGYSDGTFKPTKNITREEMAIMIQNYVKYLGYDVKYGADISEFKDVHKVSSYARASVMWCYYHRIITGKDNETRLDPKGNATRAECCKMLLETYYRF